MAVFVECRGRTSQCDEESTGSSEVARCRKMFFLLSAPLSRTRIEPSSPVATGASYVHHVHVNFDSTFNKSRVTDLQHKFLGLFHEMVSLQAELFDAQAPENEGDAD